MTGNPPERGAEKSETVGAEVPAPRRDDIYALSDGRVFHVTDTTRDGVHVRIETRRNGPPAAKATRRLSLAAFYRAIRNALVIRRGNRS